MMRVRPVRYLDPGTGSMLIQLLIGFVVGLLITARSYLKKAKKKLKQILGGTEDDDLEESP